MNVLFIASECAPFIKTGGLADVVGAVPKALKALGVDVKILMPAYGALQELACTGKSVWKSDNLFGGRAELMSLHAEGLDLLLLDAPHLYDRPGSIYLDESGHDWQDNHLRFGALCHVGCETSLRGIKNWKPDIVHTHDWQAGLTPVLLKQQSAPTPKSIMTIHNIAFQGLFDADTRETLGVNEELFSSEGVEYWGKIGFLKGGIAFADKITTVSPTYARELMTPELGMGLDGLMQARRDDLSGILNGIDLDVWNPATDGALVQNYTARSLNRKEKNRSALEERFGLNPSSKSLLFCVVSRLTTQKGLDVLLDVIPHLVKRGAQLAVLGSGDPEIEEGFKQAMQKYAGSIGVIIGYDEELSHLMQGGADSILIPSRFEPCGLTQLYGLRYGTLPVVATTGGLADTVIDAAPDTLKSKSATGFTFSPVTSDGLENVISRACDMFDEPEKWLSMQRTAMRYPVDWEQSALTYLKLYEQLVAEKAAGYGD